MLNEQSKTHSVHWFTHGGCGGGLNTCVDGLWALSCKWWSYSKNPAFTNDSSCAAEREGCILNTSALQRHYPCFLSATSKRHSWRASICITEHHVLCLWNFHIAFSLMCMYDICTGWARLTILYLGVLFFSQPNSDKLSSACAWLP